VEALQFLKCAIRTDLLFHKEVSSWTEEGLLVENNDGDPLWEDVENTRAWDEMFLIGELDDNDVEY
jgi:hypothetical protein